MNLRSKQVLSGVLLLALGAAVLAIFVITAPQPPRGEARVRTTVVDTMQAVQSVERFRVSAQGVVIAATEVMIQPQVSGRIVATHPNLIAGGVIKAGEALLQIEPTDYELNVASAETQLASARAQLELEQGRQQVAEKEWSLFEGELQLGDADASLALRKPQLKAAEAGVAAAKAQLRQARVNLERTTLRAPFDAYVVSENVDVGQSIGMQSQVARLVGTDSFRVQTSLPARHLDLISLTPEGDKQAPVDVHFDFGGNRHTWRGRLSSVLGSVNSTGQMAQVMVDIDDPLALASDRPPLLLGSFVDVDLYSSDEHDVFVLPREVVRNDRQVFLSADDKLLIRDVTVAWQESERSYISDGLVDGELIVLSPIASPVNGMPLVHEADPLAVRGAEQ